MAVNRFSKDQRLKAVLDNNKHIKDELKLCLLGSIKKQITEHVTLDDLSRDRDAIWSLLVSYGVLTFKPAFDVGPQMYDLFSPNKETGSFLVETILRWEGRYISSEEAKSSELSVVSVGGITFFCKPPVSSPNVTPAAGVSEHKASASATPAAGVSEHKASASATPAADVSEHKTSAKASEANFGNTLTGLKGAFRR